MSETEKVVHETESVSEKVPVKEKVIHVKDSPQIETPLKAHPPVNIVKPTPKRSKQIMAQASPRRSTRLQNREPIQSATMGSSSKKLILRLIANQLLRKYLDQPAKMSLSLRGETLLSTTIENGEQTITTLGSEQSPPNLRLVREGCI